MLKCLPVILGLALLFTFVPPVQASFCRNSGEKTICILSIKRSAKYYWEYRAAVSINGVQKPVEIYNCRNRTKITGSKTVVPFQKNGAGELICSRFARSN